MRSNRFAPNLGRSALECGLRTLNGALLIYWIRGESEGFPAGIVPTLAGRLSDPARRIALRVG